MWQKTNISVGGVIEIQIPITKDYQYAQCGPRLMWMRLLVECTCNVGLELLGMRLG